MMSDTETLAKVTAALELLCQAAAPHHGLIPSLLDPRTGAMLDQMPAPIDGQRNGDRAFPGSNLMHDEATLAVMYALGGNFTTAADAYLNRFAGHCVDTVSGLFPWGEHAFWDLINDCRGNSYLLGGMDPDSEVGRYGVHDHLRACPLWLWQRLDALAPAAVQRFAAGLRNHWTAGTPREYIRHAWIDHCGPWPRRPRACDFPRHGGFYIFDWAFAWSRSREDWLLDEIRAMIDYWWVKRHACGLALMESRWPPGDIFDNKPVTGQTLSLAVSLLEAAALLVDAPAELLSDLHTRAQAYVDAFCRAPWDDEAGIFPITLNADGRTVDWASPIWGSRYGHWPVAYTALTVCNAFRLTGDARLLDYARAAARNLQAEPLPADCQVPAMDAGMAIELFADLFDLTADRAWLEAGQHLATAVVPAFFSLGPLPTGASGIDWYESQMGPGFLLHGLTRLALLQQGRRDLAADYTGR